MLSKKAVTEYQQIYKDTYGVGISYDEALEQGTKLINLFRVIYKPIPNEWGSVVEVGVDGDPQL